VSYTDREDLNYLGQLFLIGANQTPFLNMIGGLQGGAKVSNSFSFPIAQPWALASASQNTKSEAVAAAAPGASDVITYTRAQDSNIVQIMKYDYAVSFAKQSTFSEISGLALANGIQPVRDEMAFQKMAAMRQMAIDVEFSFLRGAYAAHTNSATNGKTRGLIQAILANAVAAGSAYLTKAMIQELVREMATNGAQFENVVMFCNAFQKQAVTDLYAYAPEDRNVGGVNIKQIETDFGMLGVVFDPFMTTTEIALAEMTVCSPVFCPYEGRIISDIAIAETAAQKGGFWYTQIGLDYGPEEYHGKITGLLDA
jgi:hypothetical protein